MQSSRAIQRRKMIFLKAEKVPRNVFSWRRMKINWDKDEKCEINGSRKKKLLKILQGISTNIQCLQRGLSSAITIFNLSKKQIDIRKSLLHDDIVDTLMDAKSTDCILIFSSCKIETSCCTLRNEDFFFEF